jgi:hypothetical protein
MSTRTAVVDVVPAGLLPGDLMRLAGAGLAGHGVAVRLPAREDERRLDLVSGGRACGLLVSDAGFACLDCGPADDDGVSPVLSADIADFLLTGESRYGRRLSSATCDPSSSFAAIAGRELRARGFYVRLEVLADDVDLEAVVHVVVTAPVTGAGARVVVSAGGAISWECDCLHYLAGGRAGTSAAVLAGFIAGRVAGALALASGREAGR